ncbi:hypothetical protein F8N49_10055 [Pseudomonas sp. GXM4]|nr:hypothetical protein F8N49_10055 [Pseudomonas sp. GXM4]
MGASLLAKAAAQSALIVPTLRVGMHPVTLCVTLRRDAERPGRHSHAERGNDHGGESSQPVLVPVIQP